MAGLTVKDRVDVKKTRPRRKPKLPTRFRNGSYEIQMVGASSTAPSTRKQRPLHVGKIPDPVKITKRSGRIITLPTRFQNNGISKIRMVGGATFATSSTEKKHRPGVKSIPRLSKTKMKSEISNELRLILTRQTFDATAKKFRKVEEHHVDDNITSQVQVNLSRGGQINIFPRLYSKARMDDIKDELVGTGCSNNLFRSYTIQGQDEPRRHFLLHKNATDDFDAPQPGYRYAQITMKARPLAMLPRLGKVADELATKRKIPGRHWNIGIHPVCYRCDRDGMGDHADDDQGETRIFCLLVDQVEINRKVRVNVFKKLTTKPMEVTKKNGDTVVRNTRIYQEGDEIIELHLRPGDAYEMDGTMQCSYSHSVPPAKKEPASDIGGEISTMPQSKPRICIMFRTGREMVFKKDSGRPCSDLSPRPLLTYFFGRNDGLNEGEMYTRDQLRKIGAFQTSQRGISGNVKEGSDAIIVSGVWAGDDRFDRLMYTASTRVGAMCLWKSFILKLPIRVFRKEHDRNGMGDKRQFYSYGGLYSLVRVDPAIEMEESFRFYLKRRPARGGRFYNFLNTKKYRTYHLSVKVARIAKNPKVGLRRKLLSLLTIGKAFDCQEATGCVVTEKNRKRRKRLKKAVTPALPNIKTTEEDYTPYRKTKTRTSWAELNFKDISGCALLLHFAKESEAAACQRT